MKSVEHHNSLQESALQYPRIFMPFWQEDEKLVAPAAAEEETGDWLFVCHGTRLFQMFGAKDGHQRKMFSTLSAVLSICLSVLWYAMLHHFPHRLNKCFCCFLYLVQGFPRTVVFFVVRCFIRDWFGLFGHRLLKLASTANCRKYRHTSQDVCICFVMFCALHDQSAAGLGCRRAISTNASDSSPVEAI